MTEDAAKRRWLTLNVWPANLHVGSVALAVVAMGVGEAVAFAILNLQETTLCGTFVFMVIGLGWAVILDDRKVVGSVALIGMRYLAMAKVGIMLAMSGSGGAMRGAIGVDVAVMLMACGHTCIVLVRGLLRRMAREQAKIDWAESQVGEAEPFDGPEE